jgi:beta-glucosidase
MNLVEKVFLLSGRDLWSTKEIQGVRSMALADGPHGLRFQEGAVDHLGINESAPATCFPPAVAVGSSWIHRWRRGWRPQLRVRRGPSDQRERRPS